MKTNLFVLVVFLVSATVASEPTGPSSIDGFVTGNAALVLGGVAVEANELNQGRYEEAASNTAGYYLMNNLPSGADVCDALAWPTSDGQIWLTWVASSLPHSEPEFVMAALAGVKPGDARQGGAFQA